VKTEPSVLGTLAISFLLLSQLAAPGAMAETVKILTSVQAGTISGADADDDLAAFYAGFGLDSSLVTGTVTATALVGVDLFVAMLPDDSFSAAEITALDDFVASGGDLLLMGEQHAFAAVENGYLNALLVGVGSAMTLDSSGFDSGFHNTIGAQIVTQPGLTDGVTLINYGNVNSLSGVSPSREIFLASNLTSVWGGFELLGSGRVILLADVNIISNLEDTAGNDNHIFFENLVEFVEQDTRVKIYTSALAGTISGADGDNDLNTFYQEAGVSSSLWHGEVSSQNLSAAELLVIMAPDDAFSPSEISAMTAFLATGGRLLFMGEQQAFAASENGYINLALSGVGSSMSLGTSSVDGPNLRDTIPGQIEEHPYNLGVDLLSYGNVNTVLGIPSGGGLDGELFLTADLSAAWGGVEELAGGGSVILVADLNLLSDLEDDASNDNHVFFLNLQREPTFLPLLSPIGSGVLAMLLVSAGGSLIWRGHRRQIPGY
jgi:hypothetical protein